MDTYSDSQSQVIQILRTAFSQRSQKNPRYSLRAFARSLGISHTVLSLVMSGKRPLSYRCAQLLVARLDLDPQQAEILINATARRRGGPQSGRANSAAITASNLSGNPADTHGGPAPVARTEREYRLIEMDLFNLFSDWVHYAILSLIEIENEDLTPKAIAARLNINETQAKFCLDRLMDLKLIEKREDGHFVPTGMPLTFENKISTSASRRFQKQLLEKAIESLENDPFEIREHASTTMAIDPHHIPYARERIRKFRRELTEELEARGSASEVYNLTVQIYPVSRTRT